MRFFKERVYLTGTERLGDEQVHYEEVDTWEDISVIGELTTNKIIEISDDDPYRIGYWHSVWGKKVTYQAREAIRTELNVWKPKEVTASDWQEFYKDWKDIEEDVLRGRLTNIWADPDAVMGFMMRGGELLIDGRVQYRCLSYLL